eukprot:1150379-Pelagomonas_calceolata.AAC.8
MRTHPEGPMTLRSKSFTSRGRTLGFAGRGKQSDNMEMEGAKIHAERQKLEGSKETGSRKGILG